MSKSKRKSRLLKVAPVALDRLFLVNKINAAASAGKCRAELRAVPGDR